MLYGAKALTSNRVLPHCERRTDVTRSEAVENKVSTTPRVRAAPHRGFSVGLKRHWLHDAASFKAKKWKKRVSVICIRDLHGLLRRSHQFNHKACHNPPRPLASRRVDALTNFQTLQTSQNLQTNLLGGWFTLPLPPPIRALKHTVLDHFKVSSRLGCLR